MITDRKFLFFMYLKLERKGMVHKKMKIFLKIRGSTKFTNYHFFVCQTFLSFYAKYFTNFSVKSLKKI